MGRLFSITASIIAALSLVSCVRELSDPDQSGFVHKASEHEVTLVADLGDGQQTKTVYNESDGKIYWKPAEELSLFYSPDENGGSKFTSTNTEDARVANFTGMIGVITAGNDISEDQTYFVGVYPYREDNVYDSNGVVMTTLPVVQTAVAGSFADDLYITAGRSKGLTMGFKAVCSAVVFSVASEGISKVELRSNHYEYLGGLFSFNFNDSNIPEVIGHVTDDSYAITLLAPDGGTFTPGVDYYIITLPAELTQGMKMTFYKADGSYGVKRWDRNINLARNVFTHVPNADRNVVFSQAVDLGLSVKWAPFNLGAETVTDGGRYYAWGATEPMTSFIETYAGPNMEVLDSEHDAAKAAWGDTWMMPTWLNWADLIDECSWEYQTNYQNSSVSGYVVTSNIEGYEGNSIFLPCVSNFGNYSYGGYYWTSTHSSAGDPFYFWMTENTHITNYNISPAVGMSIRPVQPIEAEDVLVAGTGEKMAEVSVRRNKSLTLETEFVPARTFDKSLTWYVSDNSVLSIESTEGTCATVKGRSVGKARVMAYTTSGLFAEWNVEVLPEIAIMPDFISGQGDVWYVVFRDSEEEMKNDISRIEFIPCAEISDARFNGSGIRYVCINEGYSGSGINLDDVAPVYAVVDLSNDSDHVIKFVTTADSFTPQTCHSMFYGFTNLRTITGLEYLETANETSMKNMFRDCYSLTSLDLSHFDTHNVTNFGDMFHNCRAITSLDLSTFVRSSNANMSNMFDNCLYLSTLTLGAGMDFSYNVDSTIFTRVGYAGGDVAGKVWTTFFCTEEQWNYIWPLLNETHYAAGHYQWYIKAPTSITITGEYTKIGVNWILPLRANILPVDATNKNFTWSSSNSSIVSVNTSGIITGVSAGSAIIYATTEVGNIVAEYPVTVTNTTMGVAPVTGYNDEIPGSGNNYLHTPALHALAGRETCPWVQLWEGGPKFASFNLGATVDSYANLSPQEVQIMSVAANTTIQSTPNIGGLYRYGYSVLDYRTYGGGGVGFASTPVSPYTTESEDCDMSKRLWGDNWREPTGEELSNLMSCVWQMCDGENVQFCEGCKLPGYKVSGAVGTEYEDNVIFLPATCYYYSGEGVLYSNYMYNHSGYYWTSSPSDNAYRARILHFESGTLRMKGMDTLGCQDAIGVRPVLAE